MFEQSNHTNMIKKVISNINFNSSNQFWKLRASIVLMSGISRPQRFLEHLRDMFSLITIHEKVKATKLLISWNLKEHTLQR